MIEDIKLYRELLTFCDEIREKQKYKFDGNLEFNNFHEACYKEMYYKLRGSDVALRPKEIKEKVPKLKEVYAKAARFFAEKRNEMIKGFDIQHGHWFENAFRKFLESKSIKTNKKGYPFPDIEVLKNDKTVAYFELKYIRAPFIYANNFVGKDRWDYECSLTLDVGEKLRKQRQKIEEDLLPENIPIFYVWWYDAPHVKGIFFMRAQEVFEYWDKMGVSHHRKEREGDFETKQEKGKIYPPLLKMRGFEDFLNTLEKLKNV
ncbi:hypothetical protein KKC87_04045 [Patescibacteria group bacterium]|nr:hypothetical protein [Patescibacteria group bacterium]